MLNIRQARIEDICVLKKLQFQLNEYHQANLPDDFLSPEEIEQKIDLHKIIESESSIYRWFIHYGPHLYKNLRCYINSLVSILPNSLMKLASG